MKRVQVFKDKADSWRYRVVGGNGEVLCTSEAYTRHRDARRGINALLDAVEADHMARLQEQELVLRTSAHTAARRRLGRSLK